jgi:hypothetical protein
MLFKILFILVVLNMENKVTLNKFDLGNYCYSFF